jgi:hypothetical protein
LKADKSSYYVVNGDLTGVVTQVWNLPTQNGGKPPYLLSAQIQLDAGIWSDLRTLPKIVLIAANSAQLSLVKDAAESYVGYQVRFLFMVG